MAEEYVLVEQSATINSIIHNIFKKTHRIKFTAFDVSRKYVVFGTNTGGIYIFYREPCQFFKLIPSTHGPTTYLLISPKEEHLAIAVSTGVVIIVEGCFGENFEQQVFSEHENNTVTAMKWNGNDLYCGDSTGRVSVISLKNFLTKAMLQTPAACLMHLDRQIVQLDTFSKFLLVSTKTRTVLCDTEFEKYRQIGKKMRDGDFGSCFISPRITTPFYTSGNWGMFTNSDNEHFSNFVTDAKIYCARPGIRLWQADFQGNVVVTHQFRPSLPIPPSKIIEWGSWDKLKMKIHENDRTWDNFNFEKIYPFRDKFILTFNNLGFYIFDPTSSALKFWSNYLQNIQDIKIIDSCLYIWYNDLEVSVVSLYTIEELILKSLWTKKYYLCGELCTKFFDHVQLLLPISKQIHLISILESKVENNEMLQKLTPIFEKLKTLANLKIFDKTDNGIVTVNPIPLVPESVENFEINQNSTNLSILSEQFKINQTHKTVETSDFKKLAESLNPQIFYELLMKFQDTNENCDFWCKVTFLKYFKIEDFLSSEVLNYAVQAFLEINEEDAICECKFPLPKAHQTKPKYYNIGCQLMAKLKLGDTFLKKVPYMYFYSLKNIDNINSKIATIIQFSDIEILNIHSNKITYDLWDESIRLLVKLKSGQCLNCTKTIDTTGTFEWTDFGILMVQSIKSINTIKLFKRYSQFLPKGELDHFFYQYCIFSDICNNLDNNFKDVLREQNANSEFDISLGGYLRKKYLCNTNCYDDSNYCNSSENCNFCGKSLKTPILGETKLACGHRYHQVCFVYNNKKCSVCKSV